MSEPLEFPLNFERYLELGQLALATGALDEALINFESAYDLREDIQANRLLVEVLMARSEFAKAKRIADEMKTQYLADSEYFAIYLTILIGTQSFIQGRKLLRRDLFSSDLQENWLQELIQGEQFFRKFQGKVLAERQALVADLKDVAFYQQGARLRGIEQLPQEEYVALAKGLILEGALPLLLNNGLIETLVELGCHLQLTSQTILGQEVLNLAELPLIHQQKSYQASLVSLQAQLDNRDSELGLSLQEELRLQFVLLYPLADRLIQAPERWVELFLASYFGDESDLPEAQSDRYLDLQRRLRQELASLVI